MQVKIAGRKITLPLKKQKTTFHKIRIQRKIIIA